MFHHTTWIAGESTANSLFKSRAFKVYDYISDLDIQPDKLIFAEKGFTLHFDNIASIQLGRQSLTFSIYAQIFVLVFILMYGNATLIPFALILLIFGLLIGFQPWVIISYDDEGKTRKLYLADGNGRGWSGIFGGTRVLYTNMVTTYNAHRP